MINLYLLGEKGYRAIEMLSNEDLLLIDNVIVGKDNAVINDYSAEITNFCVQNSVSFIVQNTTIATDKNQFSIAIGWRWLIKNNSNLIVFHDSILPRLRGFNPLVTALINGDNEVGVTVLYGAEDFDSGDIIIQKKIRIKYPTKIQNVIQELGNLYGEALCELFQRIKTNNMCRYKQDNSYASYSLWRDDKDYTIDWKKSSTYIKRFIDSVGFPYKGANTFLGGEKIIIKDSQVSNDVNIENRTPGKVLFKKDGCFLIVCGEGMLCVSDFYDEKNNKINIEKFRLRFT
jgi:methionyl-tRNA formyltransferase